MVAGRTPDRLRRRRPVRRRRRREQPAQDPARGGHGQRDLVARRSAHRIRLHDPPVPRLPRPGERQRAARAHARGAAAELVTTRGPDRAHSRGRTVGGRPDPTGWSIRATSSGRFRVCRLVAERTQTRRRTRDRARNPPLCDRLGGPTHRPPHGGPPGRRSGTRLVAGRQADRISAPAARAMLAGGAERPPAAHPHNRAAYARQVLLGQAGLVSPGAKNRVLERRRPLDGVAPRRAAAQADILEGR
jgi:hypothetical protein